MLLGLRTVIHPVADLDAGGAATTAMLGTPPYFDEPFYVGYSVAGYELGLDPNGDPSAGPAVYWGVDDLDATLAGFARRGVSVIGEVQTVGDGIRTVLVDVPSVGSMGLIENARFAAEELDSAGPGR